MKETIQKICDLLDANGIRMYNKTSWGVEIACAIDGGFLVLIIEIIDKAQLPFELRAFNDNVIFDLNPE